MTNALPELDPSSTALLLMDFQHAMVGAIGDAAAGPVVANAAAVLEWARANKIHVAHLRLVVGWQLREYCHRDRPPRSTTTSCKPSWTPFGCRNTSEHSLSERK